MISSRLILPVLSRPFSKVDNFRHLHKAAADSLDMLSIALLIDWGWFGLDGRLDRNRLRANREIGRKRRSVCRDAGVDRTFINAGYYGQSGLKWIGELSGIGRLQRRRLNLGSWGQVYGFLVLDVVDESSMARPLRIEYPGAHYHVTSRGNERKNIFRDNEDRKKFVQLLASAVDQFHLRLHAYVLMPNHYHLLVETPEAQLSRAIRYLNGVYTQYFNRRHKRVGHLFQGRYKAILMDRDSYLVELSRYIHLNPWRVKSGSQDPFTYNWSSLRAYTGRSSVPQWLTVEEVLASFGRKRNSAQKLYQGFVREGMERGIKTPWEQLKWQTLLGTETFVEEIKVRFIEQRGGELSEFSGVRDAKRTVEGEKIFKAICKHYGIKEEELSKRVHGYTEPRYVASYLLRRYALMTLKEIGERVGLHYSTVGNILRQLAETRETGLSRSLKQVEREIKNP